MDGQQGLPVRAARQPDHAAVPDRDCHEEEWSGSELHPPAVAKPRRWGHCLTLHLRSKGPINAIHKM